MNPITFKASTSWYDAMSGFPQDLKCEIYDAIFHYAKTNATPKLSAVGAAVFSFIRNEMEIEGKRKEAVRERLRDNGRKGAAKRNSKIK